MRSILFAWLTCLVCPVFAQDGQPEQDPHSDTKARIDAARAAYINEKLGLTKEEADKFWPIYKEFAHKRENLRQEYKNAQQQGKNEQELIDLNLKLKQRELDLEKDYSQRMIHTISAEKLMKLRTAEKDFTRLIIQQIQKRQMQQEKRQQQQERQQQQLQKRNN